MKNLHNLIKKKIVILDGATGTQLQKCGMPQGALPEKWCLENPDVISAIHANYKKAGADIIYTSTFGANRIKLNQYGIDNVKEVNKRLVSLAKRAVGKEVLVAGDIGPTGKFVEPFGILKFEDAVDIFKEQVKGLLSGGVDLFVIETMMDIQEARAALIAVKEITDKFTIVTMTYEKDSRTLNGTDPATALITLQSLGADAVGCNCSTGPQAMLKIVENMKPYATVPLVAKPNAGMPKLVGGKTLFGMDPREFASFGKKFVSCGVNMIGGCCGTTPKHIRELRGKIYDVKPVGVLRKSISALSSARKYIIVGQDKPLSLVGERINPNSKNILQKNFRNELRAGKTSAVRRLAREQENEGADLFDVNVGVSDIDEKEIFKKVIIDLLTVSTSLPLVIDSLNVGAIEAALRIYPGRALINSISGEKRKLKKLLSIAAKYGAMFIILPLDEKGIPKDFQKRKKIIQDIYRKACEFGFTKDDVIVDGLMMAVSSYPSAALETLQTISWCSKVFETNTIIGLSNISFGMPKDSRPWLNSAYLAMAQAQGLTMVIADSSSEEVMNIKRATDVLIQKDKNVAEFLSRFSTVTSVIQKDSLDYTPAQRKVYYAILHGNKEEIKEFIDRTLSSGQTPDELIHNLMIPAINKVGELYDKKEYFLPQLIASAETMKIAFEYLKPRLTKDKLESAKKTVVILATVKGDVHDIGKNIVALMLENHGFSVVDLGKDVSAKRIISEIKRHELPIVGLSALMTTTMINIREVVDTAKAQGLNCRFLVGGAVVTPSYARSLGAEYANDSVEAVRVAKRISASK